MRPFRSVVIRRARHTLRLSAWGAVAQQLAWEARRPFSPPPAVELTWAIPADVAEDVVVLWPRRYSSSNAAAWLDPVRTGIAHHVRTASADIPQLEGNIAHIVVKHGDRRLKVGVDYDDLSKLHESVDDVDLYFKMQFQRGGYAQKHVVPGGYVSRMPGLYRHASRWRAWSAAQTKAYDVFARFGLLEPGAALRRAMLELMETQRSFSFRGGTARTTSWEHLQEVCRSKICLDAPGRGELCGRLVECLGAGVCIVGPALENELHVPLENGLHEVRVSRDLGDFVGACDALLNDSVRRADLEAAGAEYFDRYLRLEQLGGYYVDACVRAAGARLPG